MKHFSEEELIEYFYNKSESTGRQHIEACAECAEAYAALGRDLAALPALEPPVRGASYGQQVWQSIAPSLLAYEAPKRHWLRTGLGRSLSYAAVCAMLVIGAFFSGRQWEHRQPHSTAGSNPSLPAKPTVIVVLSDHLDRSERLLIELKHADAGNAEMLAPLPAEAGRLLAANRICLQDTRQEDDPALAAALDRLDHLLAELASQRDGLNAATLTRLQDEMNTDGLLFHVRVLRTRIPSQQATVTATARSKGGTI